MLPEGAIALRNTIHEQMTRRQRAKRRTTVWIYDDARELGRDRWGRGNHGHPHAEIDSAKGFRNRIGHHHRIWNMDVQARYDDLLTLAGYIDPRLRSWIGDTSRVPATIRRRPLPASSRRANDPTTMRTTGGSVN